MDTAWDRLLDLVDHLSQDPDALLDPGAERTFEALCLEAMDHGPVDRELHAPDVARWIVGLLQAHRAVRAAHADLPADDDLAVLRVMLTRWLHPARPR